MIAVVLTSYFLTSMSWQIPESISFLIQIGQQGLDAELDQDTFPTKSSRSVTLANCRVLVSDLKAFSGKIQWECFRCKLKDSDYIILEFSWESSHPGSKRIFCRFPDINESSSFVVRRTENGSLFLNLQACQPVQCIPLPTMKYISLTIRVGYVFQTYLLLQYKAGYSDDAIAGCDTSLSAVCPVMLLGRASR